MNYKWELLARAMLRTGRYWEPRVKPQLLSRHYHAGRTAVRIRSEEQLTVYSAYIAWLKTKDPSHCEIALAYVAPDLEGNGVLKDIMRELLDRMPSDLTPFLITKHPAMMRTATSSGFKMVDCDTQEIETWAAKAGIEDRLPVPSEERKLFIRQ